MPEIVRASVDRMWIAHNAFGFDAPAWERFGEGVKPARWEDTLPLCRLAGYPASLEGIGQWLFGEGKHDDRIMKLLTRATYRGGRLVYPSPPPGAWAELLKYNIRDVDLLESIWSYLCEFLGTEEDIRSMDETVNRRGVAVDVDFVCHLLSLWEQFYLELGDRVLLASRGELGSDALRSEKKVKSWLRRQGYDIKSLDRRVLQIDSFEGPAREILILRRSLTRTAVGKMTRLLESVESGRLYNMFAYHAAHTGRWSSRGVQLHNIPRGVPVPQVDCNITLDEIRSLAPDMDTDDLLSSLTRQCFVGPFSIVDYSAIEARVLAWVAGEDDMLRVFRDPARDVYVEFARKLWPGRNITKQMRAIAKDCVLGMGYGMGAKRFYGNIIQKHINITEEQAYFLTKAYRSLHPNIVALWRRLSNAVIATAAGVTVDVGILRLWMRDGTMCIRLPSQRVLFYRRAHIEYVLPKFPGADHLLATMIYTDPRGRCMQLFGGMIAENVVQAISRDILANALVRAETAGLKPVMHVHDEIVCETDDIHSLCSVASTGPLWTDGLPLRVEGFRAKRYTKHASGDIILYMNGSMI